MTATSQGLKAALKTWLKSSAEQIFGIQEESETDPKLKVPYSLVAISATLMSLSISNDSCLRSASDIILALASEDASESVLLKIPVCWASVGGA